MENEAPKVYQKSTIQFDSVSQEVDIDEFLPIEVFNMLKDISDPEHPLTLEQLSVVQLGSIHITNHHVLVMFTPTIPHCSMASLIGLSIRIQLHRLLPRRFKVKVQITPGTHQSERSVSFIYIG